MSKCRYCGKEYDGGGLWDDGFCCGRCRYNAKNRNIMGKPSKGCLYIILISIVVILILAYFSPATDKKERKKTNKTESRVKSSRSSKSETASWKSSEGEEIEEQGNLKTYIPVETPQSMEENNVDNSKNDTISF